MGVNVFTCWRLKIVFVLLLLLLTASLYANALNLCIRIDADQTRQRIIINKNKNTSFPLYTQLEFDLKSARGAKQFEIQAEQRVC